MKLRGLLCALAVLLAFIGPRLADSCGPFPAELRFTSYHGALPGEFSTGKLGVLRPHYYRRDLLLAYRTLSGVPLSASEMVASPPNPGPSLAGADAWIRARIQVPGASALPSIATDKKVPGSDYQFFPNCLDAAFESAADTLFKRIKLWGSGSPNVASWLAAQDQVFTNCAAGPAIPAALTSGDPLLAADRRYQIAAAQFYAGQFAESEAAFDRIADDASSPWRDIAPYLAARACIRAGTLGADAVKLRRAEERLRAMVADPARRQWHAAAQGLLDFVRAHTEPGERLVELGQELMKPGLGPQLDRVLTDYTTIWDNMPGKQPLERSDVAAWIDTFQKGASAATEWRTKNSLPWLVAALASLEASDASAPDLIAAAHAVKPESPAYATVAYYAIRREIFAGELDAARKWTDEALAARPPDSAANLLRAERLRTARDWTEFLRFAPRKPVADGSEGFESPLSEEESKKFPVAFDLDATMPLNRVTPLKLWIDASANPLLPRVLQGDIAQAGWVRAVLLNDEAAARTLAGRVRALRPALAAEMRGYLAAQDPAAARFHAVFLMLRGPGLQPLVRPGKGRQSPLMERDMFRDNWWLLDAPPGYVDPGGAAHEALSDLYPKADYGPREFLPGEQRAAGEQEWARLQERAGNGVNYLCAETLAWARAHPQDRRVPQALYQAVQATHYGPADKRSSEYSRQAFDLLHRRYPASEWTARTKYWY